MNEGRAKAERLLQDAWKRHGHLGALQFQAVLKDLMADCPREVFVLSAALQHGVLQELQSGPAHRASILAEQLSRKTGIESETANWSVRTWGLALGVEVTVEGVEPPPLIRPPIVVEFVPPIFPTRNKTAIKEAFIVILSVCVVLWVLVWIRMNV